MSVPYKIRVKIGANEFDAEGPEAVVKDQFQLFLEALKQPGFQQPINRLTENHTQNGNGGTASKIDSEVLKRIFIVDGDDISLGTLPRTEQKEADGVLLLLYGYRVMADQQNVLSSRLLASAKKSGLNVDRIDRALTNYMELVTKGGIKAGSRWTLRNTGITRAEEIIRTAMS